MTEDNNELYNMLGVYVSGVMLRNHLQCINKNSKDKYLQNKMRKADDEIRKLLAPIERYVKDNGAEDDIDNMIAEIHVMIDPIITPKQ